MIHLLDTGRVNAAVGDEVLEGDTGGLTTDRVEARKNDGLGRVVDHEVDAGNLLEGRMLRPSRPMIRPLRSSEGMCTEVTVTSAV